ncbi:uncharacterized protein N7484_006204 [Penicillium longicatenatum]|uniref:uncharacterized protein n=1 Tax=Penicillium longicatenatum TaxID=1561947 RepID=UPI002547EB69|nr:uncharacterized protein N7484_006204 [Penicillium longicatenatum]KAJ5643697.1 hypothetical protein N7484_006204 [Penicillium longicatenatum]
MPLQNSMRRKSTKKDARKRTSSTISNAPTQAGPVESPTISEKNNSAAPNNASKQNVKPQAASPLPPTPESAKHVTDVDVFQFLEHSDESSSASSSEPSESESDSNDDIPATQSPVANIQSPRPRASPVPHAVLISKTGAAPKQTRSPAGGASRVPSDLRPPPAPSPPSVPPTETRRKQMSPPARKPSPKEYSKSPTESSPPRKRQLQISRSDEIHSRDVTAIQRSPLPPSPPSSPEDSIHRVLQRRDSNASQVSSGYGLVASHLTHSAKDDKGAFPPLYRRFENLNHRVLLHLQDEISQMEEDLNLLDEYEEMHRVAIAEKEGNKPVPASRRIDAQSQSYSSLHYRRMDLMAALIQKTEQYNNALSAYSKVVQTLPRATDDDIQNYRSWMKTHNPIAAAETRFLDQGVDLISLTPRLAASAATAPVYMAIMVASGALLLPLLAFSMIAEFPGRLVVVTVVGGAAAAIAANYSAGIDTLVDSRDGWRCAMIYFGFMTLAAMFIP